MSLNLPYSVIRGEVVAIPVLVFNYFDDDITAEVILKNEGEFEFADVSNEVHETPSKSSDTSCLLIFKQIDTHENVIRRLGDL